MPWEQTAVDFTVRLCLVFDEDYARFLSDTPHWGAGTAVGRKPDSWFKDRHFKAQQERGDIVLPRVHFVC